MNLICTAGPGALFSATNPISTGILVLKDSTIQSGRDINGQTVASIDLDATAAAGIKAWVVNVGAERDRTRSSTNRLKITLQPVERLSGKKSLIGDVGTS